MACIVPQSIAPSFCELFFQGIMANINLQVLASNLESILMNQVVAFNGKSQQEMQAFVMSNQKPSKAPLIVTEEMVATWHKNQQDDIDGNDDVHVHIHDFDHVEQEHALLQQWKHECEATMAIEAKQTVAATENLKQKIDAWYKQLPPLKSQPFAFYNMFHTGCIILGVCYGAIRLALGIYALVRGEWLVNMGYWYLHLLLTLAWYGQLLVGFAIVASFLCCCIGSRLLPMVCLPVAGAGAGAIAVSTNNDNDASENDISNSKYAYLVHYINALLLRPFDLSFYMCIFVAFMNRHVQAKVEDDAVNGTKTRGATVIYAMGLNFFMCALLLFVNLTAIAAHWIFMFEFWDRTTFVHFFFFFPAYCDALFVCFHVPWLVAAIAELHSDLQ